MLIGPSGSGKTFLVAQFAARHELPMFSLNVMNWIVRGAKNDAQITLEQIAEFVEANDSGVLFLDEVNKLKMGHTESSPWTGDVFSELLAFLDHDIRLNAMGFEGNLDKLRERFFIVGAGAFQDKWLESSKQGSGAQIGFGHQLAEQAKDREDFYEALVRKEELVPQELLFRFCDKLLVIAPPLRSEFAARIAAIRDGIGLPALSAPELDSLALAAEESQKMFRYLEGYATTCAISLPDAPLAKLRRSDHPDQAKPGALGAGKKTRPGKRRNLTTPSGIARSTSTARLSFS
ncbi:MAG: AAA family ATPase [Verrucomicrobiae bacterium]